MKSIEELITLWLIVLVWVIYESLFLRGPWCRAVRTGARVKRNLTGGDVDENPVGVGRRSCSVLSLRPIRNREQSCQTILHRESLSVVGYTHRRQSYNIE